MKQIDLPLYKFYLIEGMTQEDLNELALERNNLSEEVYRLNNIINELENIIDIEMNKMGYAKYDSCLMLMKMKIKELKGSGKE